MGPVEMIVAKRDGEELTEDDYRTFITGYLSEDGSVMEGQMAALLMAGTIRGFSAGEARALTAVLLESGEQLDLSDLDGPTVDKHSTGGVGDGTSLVVVPLLAAAGAQVVKLSGRGLGHTGGTLDKLDAIPGMRTQLSSADILAQVGQIGCVIAAQTASLVPADKALYALRDVTGTVPSRGLIASSIMSKKLASGASTIVLDVKTGDGALMPTAEDARSLARLCVDIGTDAGRNTSALITSMDTPLGTGIGNALEVIEVVQTLSRPPEGRFAETCLALATQMLARATGVADDAARATLDACWRDGRGLAALESLIAAQGGDPRVCEDPRGVLPTAKVMLDVPAPGAGSITRIPAAQVGLASMRLGAGRQHAEDVIDPSSGIELLVREGDDVEAGQPLARIHGRDGASCAAAAQTLTSLIQIGTDGAPAPTVLEVIG